MPFIVAACVCSVILQWRTMPCRKFSCAFLRVFRYGHTFRGEAPLAWLYRISERHCFDVLRQARRFAGPEESERALVGREREAAPDNPADRIRLIAEIAAHCKQAIGETAVMYYIDAMTQEEIATAAACSRKTVKQRLAAFKQTAKLLLQDKGVKGEKRENR
jgi:RNA polymerase sigma-70 factor (ECF subfamily)